VDFLRKLVSQTIFFRSFKILDQHSRKKILVISALQIIVSIFDLFAVVTVGIIGTLSIFGIQSAEPSSKVQRLLRTLGIQDFNLQTQVALLGCFALLLFVIRTFVSIYFARRILYFLSNKAAELSIRMYDTTLSRSLLFIQRRSSQEYVYLFTIGANSLMIGVIGNFINLVSDVALLVILGSGLFAISPIIAIEVIFLFTSIAFVMYHILYKKSQKLSVANYSFSIRQDEQIIESINSFREIYVHDRIDYFVNQIKLSRTNLAQIHAEQNFLPNLSKYAIELTLIVGAFITTFIQFQISTAASAIGALAVFLAAGTRIAPAILRIQQGVLQVKTSSGSAEPTLQLIKELENLNFAQENKYAPIDFIYSDFNPEIKIQSVTFKYPSNNEHTLDDVTLTINQGDFAALVGPSGAGKTTLIDILLGVINPLSGNISISGLPASVAIKKWPGAISYVPQDILIIKGSIKDNIALGYSSEAINYDQISKSLDQVGLLDFVNDLSDGIDSQVGERGVKLSGGQRQRLGIARALYTNPKLLILDEATSSLDAISEQKITNSLQEIRQHTTVITIAHRLSTVKNADLVCYLEEGKLLAIGKYDNVRIQVPSFDLQSKLMGI